MSQAIPKHNSSGRALLLAAWVGALGTMAAGPAGAQVFTTLHSFNGANDGANSYAGLALSNGVLYGTTFDGGALQNGTVFAVNTNGTGFTVLHPFTGGDDGSGSEAGLTLDNGALYGTAFGGGSDGYGTVFKYAASNKTFGTLHTFTGNDGGFPYSTLALAGGILYGTASQGPGVSSGIVFSVNTAGGGFETLQSFTVENQGSEIQAGVFLSDGTLFGTTILGGAFGNGTVYSVNTAGTAFTNIYSFSTINHLTNSEGAFPTAGVILSGSTIYGTAAGGGAGANGTVFAVNTNGTGFTVLHTFSATSTSDSPNNDGSVPMAGLILSGNTLYGTVARGGGAGLGTVFAINTDGTGFTVLHSFSAITTSAGTNSDGAVPQAGLILAGDMLYGTTFEGGGFGYGTVFGIQLTSQSAPQLTIAQSGANVILTWPASATGFTLQSTSNLGPAAVWSAVSSVPVVVNGQNTVTNSISALQQFYRLSN